MPTEFEERVYAHVRMIPLGQTQSYGDVAAAIGHPRAARAVGSAMAKNPYEGDVPCHRVIRSDGGLGGYAFGGEDVKRQMLAHEQNQVKNA